MFGIGCSVTQYHRKTKRNVYSYTLTAGVDGNCASTKLRKEIEIEMLYVNYGPNTDSGLFLSRLMFLKTHVLDDGDICLLYFVPNLGRWCDE